MERHLNLVSEIITKYQNNDFIGTINAFNEYTNLSNDTGIYGGLYDFYIHSLIRLGFLEEAQKNIINMINLFPDQYTKIDLAYRYIHSCMYNEFEELLKRRYFTPKEYYLLGKNCFYQQNYTLAKKLFNYALNSGEPISEKPQIYLDKINFLEENPHVYRQMKYNCFKSEGETLQPGHVIRVSKIRDKYQNNKGNTDPLKLTRPYLIWKIIDDRIYSFPLSSKLRNDFRDGYVLTQESYPNSDFDRRLQDKIICLKECDVEIVDDKLTEEDFEKVIDSMYEIFCYNQSLPRGVLRMFMKDMIKIKGIHYKDIIEIDTYGFKQYYFILSTDNKQGIYSGLEVIKDDTGEFSLLSEEEVIITNESNITDKIKLTRNFNKNLYQEINNIERFKIRKLVIS